MPWLKPETGRRRARMIRRMLYGVLSPGTVTTVAVVRDVVSQDGDEDVMPFCRDTYETEQCIGSAFAFEAQRWS